LIVKQFEHGQSNSSFFIGSILKKIEVPWNVKF